MHAVLGQGSEVVPVLARMMGLPAGPGGEHIGRMGPAELQHAMFSALRSLLSRLVSAARPCSPSRTCTGPTRPRSA